jgi:nitrate reductase assembly molybdenum cofactor insertion protein NarJ
MKKNKYMRDGYIVPYDTLFMDVNNLLSYVCCIIEYAKETNNTAILKMLADNESYLERLHSRYGSDRFTYQHIMNLYKELLK